MSVGGTPTVPPIDAASMVCAALMDTPGSACSLPASSTPPAQISVGGTPTVPLPVFASMVRVAHTDTSGSVCSRCWLPRRRQLSCSVGWTPTMPSHVAASTVCALRAHGHFRRLSVPAVGFLDAASSVFGRRDTDRALTHRCIDGVRGAHGHSRLRVLSLSASSTPPAQISVGGPPTVPSNVASLMVTVQAHRSVVPAASQIKYHCELRQSLLT